MPTNNKVEPSKLEGLRIGWTCELACFKHALSHSNWQYLGIPLASVASRVLKTTLPSTAIFSNGCFIGASKRTCRTKFHRIGAKWRHTDCNLRNFSVESYIYIWTRLAPRFDQLANPQNMKHVVKSLRHLVRNVYPPPGGYFAPAHDGQVWMVWDLATTSVNLSHTRSREGFWPE